MLHDHEPGVATELDQHLRGNPGDRHDVVGDGTADELLELLGDLADDPLGHVDRLRRRHHQSRHRRQGHPSDVHQDDPCSHPPRVIRGEAQADVSPSPTRDPDDDGS